MLRKSVQYSETGYKKEALQHHMTGLNRAQVAALWQSSIELLLQISPLFVFSYTLS
jgi:hypothetical protein